MTDTVETAMTRWSKFCRFVGIPLAIAAILSACSLWYQGSGALYPETEVRLPYYLGPRTLTAKIYDSNTLDGGMYQARELSYFFDYLDARFVQWCTGLRHPHFFSMTHYLFLAAITVALWNFGIRMLRISP